ncbi:MULTISPECIES: hypothetical protein [Halorussus]|uniref:hypothetical protein n=1 Tax=Halorussus TaxID=1070314 RepID=UPI000E20CECE|nr:MULTISPECIES: hypothetical protein [Halorussus]NHN57908.1 hypothetical protein [Halorussus sp. JP-T4]
MSTDTHSRDATGATAEESTETDGTDSFFGFLVGLYAAALAAPAATIGVALAATTDAPVLFGTFLVVGVVAVAAGARVGGRRAIAVRLGDTRWSWLAPLAGLAYLGVLLAVGDGPGSTAVVWLSLLGALGGCLVGAGLVFAGHNRHAKAVLAESARVVEFSARGPARDRKRVHWAVGALMLGGMVGLAATVALERPSLRWVFHLLVAAGAGLVGVTTERTFAVADAGVRIGTPVHKRVRPWARFESYSLTDDALVLHHGGWSAWGLRDVRRDPADVDDLDAVAAVLDEHLPRKE